MTTVCFGPIDTLYLFGSGRLLLNVAAAAVQVGLKIRVITAPRHAETLVGHERFDRAVERLGLPCWTLSSLRLDMEPFTLVTAKTLGCSLGAAWVFSEDMIRLFGGRLVNCHANLPLDRGGGGFSWLILRGDRQGRSVLHLVDRGIDTGDIICSREYLFPERCRIPQDFAEERQAQDTRFLSDFLTQVLREACFDRVKQDPGRSTYWPRLDTEIHGAIDWSWSAGEIERFICAFDRPYPGAYTYVRGSQIRLRDCRLALSDAPAHPFQSGLVYRIHDGRIYVACSGGSISLGHVLFEDGADAKGHLALGDRFWSTDEVLQRARVTRVLYTSTGKVPQADLVGAAWPKS